MAIYGRITEDGLVLEVCELDPATCFHPDIAVEFEEVPDGAAPGDSVVNGKLVKAPEPEAPEAPAEPVVQRLVPRAEFLGALQRSERIALEGERGNNAELNDFLTMLEINGVFDLDNAEDIELLDSLVKDNVLSDASLAAIQALR